MGACKAGVLGTLLLGLPHLSVAAAEVPSPDEIAARLIAITPRAPGQILEEEWDRPEITCTPIEARGMFYDEGQEIVRRPRMQMEVSFAFGSAELAADAIELLDQLAAAIESPVLADTRFLLVGHTDGVGSEEANEILSQRRARAVYEHLVEEHGVDPERLQPRGCGEAVLLVVEDPRSPRNRRVEVINAGP